MSAVPPLPFAQPNLLAQETLVALDRLSTGLDAQALTWLSGYFAGRAAVASGVGAPAAVAATASAQRLAIVYASHTGNGKRIAEKLKAEAEAQGLAVRLFAADQYPTRELASERLLYAVVSTHGDGDPPDAARGLFDFLLGKRAPKLAQLKFAVLALGDSSYPKFCEAGRVLDQRLAELGAERALALTEVDVDFETVASQWRASTVDLAKQTLGATATPALRVVVNNAASPAFDRERPFAAELLANQRLTTADGWRDVRHLEFSLADSGLRYEPGDALGVIARNQDDWVTTWLRQFKLDGEHEVQLAGRTWPLRQVLSEHKEITRLAKPLIALLAERGGYTDLQQLLRPGQAQALAQFLKAVPPIELINRYPIELDAQSLVDALRPLTPRLYSIASSRAAVGEEVHLTVAVDPQGVASRFLAAADPSANAAVRIFVEANTRFRLPKDPARDLIMIGPGTGVAPFRGFLQERIATGATGRHWLFFGAPRLRQDFLYQTEWLDARKAGQLHRLDVAFSRDQADKVYVQHRLRAAARELYAWLDNGASIYVCGDAERMAPDVHQTLIDIVAEQGGVDLDTASERVNGWLNEGRYARDVY